MKKLSEFSNWLESTKESQGKRKPVNFVPKGWGHETWIANSPLYCGKILHMFEGKCLSWHFHKLKDETFYLYSGKVILLHGYDEDIEKATKEELNPGDCFYVPAGLNHRLIAVEDSDIVEISTEHFDDDSYRLLKGD